MRWPMTTRSPVICELARLGVSFQHRCLRLFDLEEKRLPLIGKGEGHKARRTDAADSDDFQRDVVEFVTVAQHADVRWKRLEIPGMSFARDLSALLIEA